jgi:DNA polymerase
MLSLRERWLLEMGVGEPVPRRRPVLTSPSSVSSPTTLLPDWQTLQEMVASCRRCGLRDGCRQTVFGVGSSTARWMLVGEGPGEQEDRQGEPFVGKAGLLLDRMLASIGLARGEQLFITNVVKCRPPGNRDPKPEEIVACHDHLQSQLRLIRPKFILLLGRHAAQTLLQTDKSVSSLRARVHSVALPGGGQASAVVTYHPAYLLRNPSAKLEAWRDLQLALRQS